jgi:hypothetical protein
MPADVAESLIFKLRHYRKKAGTVPHAPGKSTRQPDAGEPVGAAPTSWEDLPGPGRQA